MSLVSGGAASDTATEVGTVRAWFLGSSVPTGAQTITVTRTNNATEMYAVAFTVTASYNTEVYTSGIVLLQENGAFSEQSVTDGSPGSNSLRFAGGYSGGTAIAAGASSTMAQSIAFASGSNSAGAVYETTAGQGSRSIGFSNSNDDRAGVHFAVREIITYDFSGTIYQSGNEGSAFDCSSGGPYTVNIRVNGSGSYSGTCTANTGAWSVTGVSVTSGQTIYAYISGESVKGNTVLVSSGATKADVPIYVDRVALRDDANGSITNTEISAGNTADSDDLISFSGSDITVASTYEIHIYTGDTYAPGANVSTGKLHVVGTYTGSTETLTFTGSGTGTSRPLYVDGGTFTAPTNTVFAGTANSEIENTAAISDDYQNLSFTPTISGNISYTFLGDMKVNGNFDMNPTSAGNYTLSAYLGGSLTVMHALYLEGTTSGKSSLITYVNPNSYDISAENYHINAAGTLDATGSTSTIGTNGTTGTLFEVTGTFNPGNSAVTFGSDFSVVLTSGDITFYNLSLAPSNDSADEYWFGSGTHTINGDFTINPNGIQPLTVYMNGNITVASGKTTTITRTNTATSSLVTGAGNPTLSTGNLNIATGGTLDGTGSSSTIKLTANSTPFTRAGTFNPGSTTFVYEPAGTSGVNVASGTYHHLTFNKTGNTFSLTSGGVTTDTDGNLTISAGTLDAVSGSNYPITVGGNWTNNGTFLAQQGTVTFIPASPTVTIAGATTFYNFTSTSAGKTLDFTSSTTFRINGLLTLTGANGNYINITSTTGNSHWYINHQGTENITYADVSWSGCDASSTQITLDATNHNGGNNGACWVINDGSPTPTAEPTPMVQVSRWMLDEGQGATAHDQLAKHNDLTLTNTFWATGSATQSIRSQYLSFNGTTSLATRATDTDFDFGTGSFTVAGWFRHPSLASGTQVILARYGTAGFKVYMNSTGKICFDIDADSSWGSANYDTACNTVSLADSKWHHFEAVKTGTSSIDLYIDGNFAATDTSLAAGTTLNTSSALYIGVDSTGNSNWWKGSLSDIVFYSTARTAAQIKSDMNSGSASVIGSQIKDSLTEGLVGYWKLDESAWTNDCTATGILDYSGNNLNAMSCAAGVAGPTGGQPGKFGNSGYLNNNDIQIPWTSILTMYEKITVSAWIKPNDADGGFLVSNAYNDDGWRFSLNSDLSITFEGINDYAPSTITSGAAKVTSGAWSMVTATFDMNQQMLALYINGNQVASKFYDSVLSNGGGNPLLIGLKKPASANVSAEYYTGNIDDVRIYRRALTQTEVAQLYNWAPGPVGWWKMDEGSGTSVNDSSGNGNIGTWNGTLGNQWLNGKYGKAGNLNGTNNYIDVPANTSLNFNDYEDFTLSAWVKIKGNPSSEMAIVSNTDGESPGYELKISVSGRIRGRVMTACCNGVESTDDGTVITDNKWHHVVVVFGRTSGMTRYIDGILSGSADDISAEYYAFSTVYGLRIGARLWITPDQFFSGQIDELKLYNYARTQKQIVEDMNAGHPAPGSPVGSALAHWNFNEGAGDSAHNLGNGGSALNGDLSGTCPGAATCPTWSTQGKIGKALSFDGVNDSVSASVPMSDNQSFTLSAWYNASDPTAYQMIAGNDDIQADLSNKGVSIQVESGWARATVIDATGTTHLLAYNLNSFNPARTWHHIAVTYDYTTSQALLYVDGIHHGNGVGEGYDTNTVTGFKANTAGSWRIGNQQYGFMYFKGLIDEVKLYNLALTEDQIRMEFNQGKSTVMGALSNTSNLSGGSVASTSASAAYCVPGSSDSCAPPAGEWKMDEGSGQTLNDTSGNNNNGTITGSVWTTGKSGKALNFNSSTSVVNAGTGGTALANPFDGGGTYEAWIFPRSAGGGNLGRIISKGGYKDLMVNPDVSGIVKLTFAVNFSGGAGTWSITGIPLNKWTHVAVTYNNDNTTNVPVFYVNGKFTTLDTSGQPTGTRIDTSVHDFLIGNYQTPNRGFDGLIDDLKVFRYIRTPAQIAWDYNKGAPIAQYNFNECSGTVLHDTAPKSDKKTTGFNGTITPNTGRTAGTCESGVSTEMWNGGTSGKYGASLAFDGAGDYVNFGNNAFGDFGDTFSLAAWIKTSSSLYGVILSEYSAGTCGDAIFSIDNDKTTFADGGAYYLTGTKTVTDGNWHHVMFVSDATNSYIYVDGVLDKTGSHGNWRNTCTNVPVIIGKPAVAGGSPGNFNGQIDDVRVYNYALTADQVKMLYNRNSAVQFSD
jgi:hypothetical protein